MSRVNVKVRTASIARLCGGIKLANARISLGRATTRLELSREELEAVIAARRVKALSVGHRRLIPTREIERLERLGES